MNDSLIDEFAIHYNATKNREYRNRVITRFKAFVAFLQDHDLTVRQLLAPSEIPPITFKIMTSDLTDEGNELIKDAYNKWLKAKNRGEPMDDTSFLEKRLTALRNAKNM